jgi:hypothetical protein
VLIENIPLGLAGGDSGYGRLPATLYFCHWYLPLGAAVKAYANAAVLGPAMRANECCFYDPKTRQQKRFSVTEKFRQ